MYNTSFFKKILLLATIATFYSCDKDFNAIGDDLIGDNHFDLVAEDYSVTAYNQKVTPVAANNLPINALGIYSNPVFGETVAHFNTQVALDSYAPTFGEGVVIDSVTLNIPYFSTPKTKDGVTTYELDSIYGPETGKIKLSVYESGIFLNTYNANNYDFSKFYNTDRSVDFQTQAAALGPRLNDSGNSAENNGFFFNSKEIVETTPAVGTTPESKKRIKPEMRLHLNKDFFKTKIFGAPSGKLASDEVFKNYFKGLYFKVEKSDESPTASRMAIMNFRGGKINIFYKSIKPSTANPPVIEMESKTLVINLGNTANTSSVNTVNLLEESNLNPDYVTATANDLAPDERLYLKGGQGSIAVIELFDKTDLGGYDSSGNWETKPNNVSDELDEIRNNVTSKEWLANEANLVFTVDSQKMTGVQQPGRVYLYDLTNNTVLTDYSTDRSSSLNGDPKKNRTVYGGMINIDPVTKIATYKIRITNHIRNMIKNADVANVKLGLVVTEDINIITSSRLDQTKINVGSVISAIPTASLMNSLGTVLYGSNLPESDTKRLKLEVYYTKPN